MVPVDPGPSMDLDGFFVVDRFETSETGLLGGGTDSSSVGGTDLALTAETDGVAVAFRIDLDAPVTRQGTVGR